LRKFIRNLLFPLHNWFMLKVMTRAYHTRYLRYINNLSNSTVCPLKKPRVSKKSVAFKRLTTQHQKKILVHLNLNIWLIMALKKSTFAFNIQT